MTDKEILNSYASLVPFLAQVCGPACEIVLHDVTNPQHSMIAICNSVSGRQVGSPMTDFAHEIMQKGLFLETDYLSNYRSQAKGAMLSSSTFFIKNNQRLVGMLCINKDLRATQDAENALRAVCRQFNLTMPLGSEISETLDNSFEDILIERAEGIIAQTGVPVNRMSMQEKIELVRQLNDAGVLMMKGAIPVIAERLSVSVPTVYRYLSKLSAEGEKTL